MEIKLSSELQEYVQGRVKSGEYRSVDDIVEEALKQHRLDERQLPEEIMRELEAADADIEAGNYIEIDDFAAAIRKKYGS